MIHEDILVEVKYGSHLYGTATAESDLDIKGIFIPQARDILLQRTVPVISLSRPKVHGENNTAADVDYELYNPEKYLSLLAKGQSVALEMLFAPDSALLSKPHPAWNVIKALAPQILTKRAVSFVHYCKQQANKYCIKGARIAAAKQALVMLTHLEEQYGAATKLSTVADSLKPLADTSEFITIEQIALANGSKESCIDICGKKALFNASIKSARLIVQNVIDEYGQRAREAERNDGVDWKALMHAVRVGHQALEFLKDHRITFPRPEAAHLLAIKQGKIHCKQVAEEIEQLLNDVERAAQYSTLPETYDQKIIDDFIEQLYVHQVFKGFKHAS
jgi:hypothetical protein